MLGRKEGCKSVKKVPTVQVARLRSETCKKKRLKKKWFYHPSTAGRACNSNNTSKRGHLFVLYRSNH